MTRKSKLFIAAFLLALLICVCIIVFKGGFEPQESSSASGNTQESSKPLSSNSEIKQSNSQKDVVEFFSKKEVHRVDLHLDTNKWNYLNENALDEEYVEANVSINGEDIGLVGLRYKGDSTLRQCVDGSGKIKNPKTSMKIKFSEYDKGKRFLGLKRLNFNAMNSGLAYMEEQLSFSLFEEMGIISSRTTWAFLTVNDKKVGLFAVIEQIDGRFTNDRYPHFPDGNLYKEITFTHSHENGLREKLKTNKPGDVSRMAQIARELSTLSQTMDEDILHKYIDVDHMVRYMAVDVAIGNWDGIRGRYCFNGGCGFHNHYIYDDENKNKVWLIPWDLNYTWTTMNFFPTLPQWNDLSASCEERHKATFGFILQAPGCDPVLKMLATYHNEEYLQALKILLNGPFSSGTINQKIDTWETLISDSIKEDPSLNYDVWKRNLSRFKKIVADQQRKAEALSNGKDITHSNGKEITQFGLHSTELNDFEDLTTEDVAPYLTIFSNPNSTIAGLINDSSPISGSNDFRSTFEYRNDGTPEKSPYSLFRIPLKENLAFNLSSSLRLKMKGDALNDDKTTLVRISLYNPNHAETFFSWKVEINSESHEYTLYIKDLVQEEWASDKNTPLSTVLKGIGAIEFSVQPEGKDGTGFPNGFTDSGWISIDDIEVSMK